MLTANTLTSLTIPSEYGYVLIVAVLLGLELVIIGFAIAGAARRKAFPKEFLDKHFGEEHKKATG
jgi:hypothetical protein